MELDARAQFHAPALAKREIEPDDLEVWRRAHGILALVDQPATGFKRSAAELMVAMIRIPMPIMVKGDLIGLFLVRDAL